MRLLYTFLKDLKVSFKTYYVYIEIIMALVFVAVLLFVVPENFFSNANIYTHIDKSIPTNISREALIGEDANMIVLDSVDEIKDKLKDDKNSIGMSISIEDNKLVYDVIMQGYENAKYRNILEKALLSQVASELPAYQESTKVIVLNDSTEKLSDRLNMLPVFLLLNSSFVGLFIIAAYIFMDKDEGSIKAFAVTPARVWEYLLSKMGVMLVTGLITALITTIIIAGSKAHYIHFIALLIATNIFGSAVGLFISSFYDSITKSMGALYITVIMFAFATVSYYMPSFSPFLIKILPSYPMLFAFREVLLNQPDTLYIYYNVVGFTLLGIVFFLLANKRFKKTLTV